MKIVTVGAGEAERLAPLAAAFRAALRSYRGIASAPDVRAGEEELRELLAAGFPVYAAEEDGRFAGYAVCRVEGSVVWAEQLYVVPERRREGIASALYGRAEELARSLGEETVYNWVHPNNDGVIAFLRSRGCTVLNLVELRRPYPGERLTTEITVGEHRFDY